MLPKPGRLGRLVHSSRVGEGTHLSRELFLGAGPLLLFPSYQIYVYTTIPEFFVPGPGLGSSHILHASLARCSSVRVAFGFVGLSFAGCCFLSLLSVLLSLGTQGWTVRIGATIQGEMLLFFFKLLFFK